MRKVVNQEAMLKPQLDSLGKWIVRTDSRRQDWDTVFQGAGDVQGNKFFGTGTAFSFDFGAPSEDIRWVSNPPEGFVQQKIQWEFSTPVYVKEGTLYFSNMPRGSYCDFFVVAKPGVPYVIKRMDQDFNITREQVVAQEETIFHNWVVHYLLEGNCTMGDELNTESAAEYPTYPFHTYETVITIPSDGDYSTAHGHWSLEIYRPGTLLYT
jgi:hypothetical protein